MSLTYIKQREANDCGVAAIAMACGRTYEGVAADIWKPETHEGLNDDLVKDWLFRNGWAWQERTRNLWRGNGFRPHDVWPPRPFASTHICFVEATAGWHYCAMDFAGRVFDPWAVERQTLAHPDYKRVSSVLGLFQIKDQQNARGHVFECPDCGADLAIATHAFGCERASH